MEPDLLPPERLTYEFFSQWLKTTFRVGGDGGGPVELELREITPRQVFSSGGARNRACETFALTFAGPADRLLPQRMYFFESERIGRFELFIVPVACDRNGALYQATFNRFVEPG